VGSGPYTGLVPDLVKKNKVGLASGWLGAGFSLGSVLGLIGTGFLVKPDNFWNAYIFLVALFIFFALPTLLGIREIPRPPPPQEFSWKILVSSFYLDPKIYGNFYLVILTRFFFTMGVYTVVPFLQYFFKEILKVANPALLSSLAIAILVLMGIPSTLVAGHLSDKYGRKSIVYVSLVIMLLLSGSLAVVTFFPSLAATFVIAVIIGIGYGAFIAVDWAIALDTVPPGADTAKDLGIWHLAIILPNVIAPLVAGVILNSVKLAHSAPAGYCTVFMVAFGWWVLSGLFFIPVKLPPRKLAS
jgi:MFS family permease